MKPINRRLYNPNLKRELFYYDENVKSFVIKIIPGERYISSHPDHMIVTVIAESLAACVCDPKIGVGGMCHLHASSTSIHIREGKRSLDCSSLSTIENLIQNIVQLGGERRRLEIKLFGAAVISTLTQDSEKEKNLPLHRILNAGLASGSSEDVIPQPQSKGEFLRAYLSQMDLSVISVDVGGALPRRIYYHPVTGAVHRLMLRRATDLKESSLEKKQAQSLSNKNSVPDRIRERTDLTNRDQQ